MTDHKVYLGLGSNIQPAHFIEQGLTGLNKIFGPLDISRVYEGDAIGFDGPVFYNLVVGLTTTLTLESLATILRDMEHQHGRPRECRKFSSRSLDIDILTFDDDVRKNADIELPREEITQRAFVLCPFAEIAPTLSIPGQTLSLAQLWQQFDQQAEPLQIVPFRWLGTDLPQHRCE
jgi:2-amino-4-hydroxy-6-hydroxymethyldihydropteridine diphosphokinase